MIAAQETALKKLNSLEGVWRGSGWMIDSPGETPRAMVQTYRVGPALDGTLEVMEARAYLPDGQVGFHAFNTISFDAQKGAYIMTARAGGRSGDFSFTPTADGYIWEIGGGGRGLRYTGVLKDGVWTELGESIDPGRPPIRMSEWTVKRIGPTTWPDGGAIGAR
jgi:hypothetical protein